MVGIMLLAEIPIEGDGLVADDPGGAIGRPRSTEAVALGRPRFMGAAAPQRPSRRARVL